MRTKTIILRDNGDEVSSITFNSDLSGDAHIQWIRTGNGWLYEVRIPAKAVVNLMRAASLEVLKSEIRSFLEGLGGA